MPAVVLGAALAGAAAAATGGVFLQAFATSLLLGGLSHALAPKPKKQSPLKNITNQTLSVRQPVETHKHIYGHMRAGGVYAHMTTVGQGVNAVIHSFLVISASELTAIDEVWVNDYPIPSDWIDANGMVTQGRYANKLRIRKHLGSATQVADSVAVAEITEWTNSHRLQGRGYLYITCYKDNDVYPTGFPNFSAIVRGRRIIDVRSGENLFSANLGMFVYDYLKLANYGFEAEKVPDTPTAASNNICDEVVDTETKDMVVSSIALSTDIITFNGDRLLFEYGDRVVVVAPGSPPGGLNTMDSYYVIPYQMKDSPRIKLASSMANAFLGIAIDITSSGSGTITIRKNGEPRYHGAGILDTGETLESNLSSMLLSMAGRVVHSGDVWKILPGAWREPEIELTLTDQRGRIGWNTEIPMSQKFNSINGIFVSSLNNYQPADFPAAFYQAFIDQDNGVEYPSQPIELSYTNRPTTGQRIAKIELFRSRQKIIFTSEFTMKAYQLEAGDNTSITIEEFGWDEKPFEVTESAVSISSGVMLNRLTLRETAQQIFDWSSGEAIEFDPAPNTNLPNPYNVQAPNGVFFSSRFISTVDGDSLYTLVLGWNPHPDSYVTEGGFFDIQFKLSSASEWSPSFSVLGALTSSDVVVSSVNVSYDLRVRARNQLGRRSGWTSILGAVVGSSGGVGATDNWQRFTDSVSVFKNWQSFSDTVTATEDWGFFT